MADNFSIFDKTADYNAPDVWDIINRMMADLHVAAGLRTKETYTPNGEVAALTDDVLWFENNLYIPVGVEEFSFEDDSIIHVWAWNVDTWDETTSTASMFVWLEEEPVDDPITINGTPYTHAELIAEDFPDIIVHYDNEAPHTVRKVGLLLPELVDNLSQHQLDVLHAEFQLWKYWQVVADERIWNDNGYPKANRDIQGPTE